MLRVAILCSQRAPGLVQLLDDPRHGSLFEVVACLASEHDFADRDALVAAGVPVYVHDIGDFYRGWNARRGDMAVRALYDTSLVQRLATHGVDVVILCSYLYIATNVLLEAYPGRVVNIHHSDLPKYPGLHAVRDAIMAGERETRATAHLVTPQLDAGPAIARSWAFAVHPMTRDLLRWNATKILRAYAFAHQEWMIESTWAPLMTASIEWLATREKETIELEPPGRHLHLMRSQFRNLAMSQSR